MCHLLATGDECARGAVQRGQIPSLSHLLRLDRRASLSTATKTDRLSTRNFYVLCLGISHPRYQTSCVYEPSFRHCKIWTTQREKQAAPSMRDGEPESCTIAPEPLDQRGVRWSPSKIVYIDTFSRMTRFSTRRRSPTLTKPRSYTSRGDVFCWVKEYPARESCR
ncbi:hypothetical protein BC826DRAFT_988259 [Russula brevipes]|nr:hypothetical protein BC826DRAFT_988259 [Russula brevipes]